MPTLPAHRTSSFPPPNISRLLRRLAPWRELPAGLLTAAIIALAAVPAAAQPAGAAPPAQPRPAQPDEPTSLTAEQKAGVSAVLAPYNPDRLTADDAKAIKRALRDAGLRRSVVLDKAIRAAGFSPERLEILDPRPAQQPPGAHSSIDGAPQRPYKAPKTP